MQNFFLVLLAFIFIGCASGKKNNLRMNTVLSVQEMQSDLKFVERKLFMMHPDIDWYISKDELHKKFDSLSNTIIKPLKPNDFYLKIAPLIASVHQGHMNLNLLSEQYEKSNKKKYKGSKSPLFLFDFYWKDNFLYILKNNSENKEIKEGSIVLEINGILPQQLYKKYRPTITSDGFNETFIDKWFGNKINSYYASEIGILDSITIKINCADSISDQTVHRIYKNKHIKDKFLNSSITEKKSPLNINKDSINPTKKILSKEQSKAIKDSLKMLTKKNHIYGFNTAKKDYIIELSFPTNDSTFAVLKIKAFSGTKYKKAYKAIFKEIKDKNVQNLVLDLRGNTGGRLNEINELYSYLTKDEEYILLKPTIVTSKWKLPFYMYAGRSILHYTLLSPFYLVNFPFVFFNTKKGHDGNFYFKLKPEKLNKRKGNYYDNELFVLTDGLSFSASSIISSNLKGTKRATFIGNETGGTFNGTVAGRLPLLTLPNSKLKWRLGVMSLRPIEQIEELGHGVRPDIIIIPTVDEIINKVDPEIDWIINKLGIE